MDKQKFNIKKFFEKTKPSDYIYLGVLLVFIILVLILFSYSTKFIANNITKIFSSNESTIPQGLDIEQYNLIIKKLGFTASSIDISKLEEGLSQKDNTSTINDEPITKTESLDKKALTISILNSTTKKGVAAILNKSLMEAGFSGAIIGNEKTPKEITTITIKNDKKEYAQIIKDIVINTYPSATLNITEGNENNFDVIIVIGKNN